MEFVEVTFGFSSSVSLTVDDNSSSDEDELDELSLPSDIELDESELDDELLSSSEDEDDDDEEDDESGRFLLDLLFFCLASDNFSSNLKN